MCCFSVPYRQLVSKIKVVSGNKRSLPFRSRTILCSGLFALQSPIPKQNGVASAYIQSNLYCHPPPSSSCIEDLRKQFYAQYATVHLPEFLQLLLFLSVIQRTARISKFKAHQRQVLVCMIHNKSRLCPPGHFGDGKLEFLMLYPYDVPHPIFTVF